MGNYMFKSTVQTPSFKNEVDSQPKLSKTENNINDTSTVENMLSQNYSGPDEDIISRDAYPKEENTSISKSETKLYEYFNWNWPLPSVHNYNIDSSELKSMQNKIQKLDTKLEPVDTYDVRVDQSCNTRQFAMKRLKDDMVELFHDAPVGITAIPMDDDIFLWKTSLLGPHQSPFEGIPIQGIIQFPAEYPYVPPTVMFSPSIFHPNVSESGDLCLHGIHKHWTPCYALSSFLTSIKYLLAEPFTLDPANPFAAQVFDRNHKLYEEMAYQSALQHIK